MYLVYPLLFFFLLEKSEFFPDYRQVKRYFFRMLLYYYYYFLGYENQKRKSNGLSPFLNFNKNMQIALTHLDRTNKEKNR